MTHGKVIYTVSVVNVAGYPHYEQYFLEKKIALKFKKWLEKKYEDSYLVVEMKPLDPASTLKQAISHYKED